MYLVGDFNPSEKYELVNWDNIFPRYGKINTCSKSPDIYNVNICLYLDIQSMDDAIPPWLGFPLLIPRSRTSAAESGSSAVAVAGDPLVNVNRSLLKAFFYGKIKCKPREITIFEGELNYFNAYVQLQTVGLLKGNVFETCKTIDTVSPIDTQ